MTAALLCWHCSHPIEANTIQLPIQYDERTDVYKTLGQFCSFECAKAYNRDTGHYRSGERGMLLARMKRRMLGRYEKTVPAPPRQCLRVFGGKMTIEEFRASSDRGEIVDILPVNTVPHEQIMSVTLPADKSDLNVKKIDFKGILAKSTSQNEMLRLRRPQSAEGRTESSKIKHGSLEQFVRK